MKVGDAYDCPACGESSFLKKESVMDGWTKVGEVLKCAACGAVVEKIDLKKNTVAADPDAAASSKLDAFAALLGGTKTERKNLFENTERRFCRDCKYRVTNAFRIYCSKHDKDVNPMDDCPDFEQRTVKE